MFGKTRKIAETAPEDRVSLKPILGLRPGMYLAALYALSILAGLFALLVLPGISNPGSRVGFTSEPSGAAVRIDGVYVGTAPCDIFVPRGIRRIAIVLPGFDDYEKDLTLGNRIFASLLFPKRYGIHAVLDSPDPVQTFAAGSADFARWSFAGEATATYQIPRTISEAAYRIGTSAIDPDTAARLADILKASARFAADKASARDLLRAQFLIDSGGASPSPLGMVRSLRRILSYLSESPGSSAWISALGTEEAAREVAESEWHLRQRNGAARLIAQPQVDAPTPNGQGRTGTDRSIDSLRFKSVPAGTVVMAGTFPRQQAVETFHIADSQVDGDLWKRFLADRSNWAGDQKKALIEKSLVDGGYLEISGDPQFPNPSVSGISHHAASAFCGWLSDRLPPELSGYEVRLPTEAEWERAAGFYPQMLGGLWEWCADPFAPLDFLPAPDWAIRQVGSSEFTVKGGSWANQSGTVTASTRASLPPDSCSDFVGFRPVLVRASAPATEGIGRR